MLFLTPSLSFLILTDSLEITHMVVHPILHNVLCSVSFPEGCAQSITSQPQAVGISTTRAHLFSPKHFILAPLSFKLPVVLSEACYRGPSFPIPQKDIWFADAPAILNHVWFRHAAAIHTTMTKSLQTIPVTVPK